MKTLEKDRARRYPSPMDLARDLDRHLNDLPVEARPPTLSYRAGRFIRRNRVGVTFVMILLALIVGSGAALAVLYARSLRAERLAQSEAATSNQALEFMTNLFRGADPFNRGSDPPTARELLDTGAEQLTQLEGQPEVQIRLMETIGDVYRELGSWDQAREILATALRKQIALGGTEHDLGVANIQWLLGYTEILAENYERAEELVQSSLTTRLTQLGAESIEVIESRHMLSFCYVRSGRYAEAEQQSRQVVDIARRKFTEDHRSFADYVYVHGWALWGLKRHGDAFPLFEESLHVRREHHQWETPATGWTLNMYGRALIDEGSEDNVRRGISLLEEALRINTELFDGRHAEIAFNKINISAGYRALEDYVLAENYALEALEVGRDYFDESGLLSSWTRALAVAVANQGRYEEAESILIDLIERQLQMPKTEAQRERTERMLKDLYDEWGQPEKYDVWLARGFQER